MWIVLAVGAVSMMLLPQCRQMIDCNIGVAPTTTSCIIDSDGNENIKHQDASEANQREVRGDGRSHNALTVPQVTNFSLGDHANGTSPISHRDDRDDSKNQVTSEVSQRGAGGDGQY